MTDEAIESLLLAPEARSPSVSRRFVKEALARWELEELTDTAVLLTSELVTNAIVHAQTEVAVTIHREDRLSVTISVQDGSTMRPRLAPHADDSATGRGIEILEELATSWAVIPLAGGKTVRFTLEASAFSDAPAPCSGV